MPKVPNEVTEESINLKTQAAFDAAVAAGTVHMSYPVVITAVNRKINTGNFENIDTLVALSVPVLQMPHDLEAFKEAVSEAVALGFGLASRETLDRYNKIKEMQDGGR